MLFWIVGACISFLGTVVLKCLGFCLYSTEVTCVWFLLEATHVVWESWTLHMSFRIHCFEVLRLFGIGCSSVFLFIFLFRRHEVWLQLISLFYLFIDLRFGLWRLG